MRTRIDAAFRPAKESVSWARDAISELHEEGRAYFSPELRSIVKEVDPHTLKQVHKIKLSGPIPLVMRRKATEALTRTKEAFDQSTFAAQILLHPTIKRKLTYFPWATDPTDLKVLLEKRRIDERLWDLFESYQPYPTGDGYPGGCGEIRALATLANDKHTVGLKAQPVVTLFTHPMQPSVVMTYFFPPAWDPVNNEAVIATWDGDVEPDRDYNIKFKILFDDARFAHSMNVTAALDVFASAAEVTIEQLSRRCDELLR